MEIIPALDIIDGKCVRLTQGDYDEKRIYNEHPLEVAKQFEAAGLTRLHLVDLDGAKKGTVVNWKVLEAIAGNTALVVDFGGGIKTESDLNMVFGSGATLATIGSLPVKDRSTFLNMLNLYGPAKFLLGADVKDEMIAIGGWLEQTNTGIMDFIESYIDNGVQQIFCTDISKDGKLEGPAIGLYKKIISQFPTIALIASGGVAGVSDLYDLEEVGCAGVIIGKAIYENRISLNDIVSFNTRPTN